LRTIESAPSDSAIARIRQYAMYSLGYGQRSRGTMFPEEICIDADTETQEKSLLLRLQLTINNTFLNTKIRIDF
jgi:hypothetical protein